MDLTLAERRRAQAFAAAVDRVGVGLRGESPRPEVPVRGPATGETEPDDSSEPLLRTVAALRTAERPTLAESTRAALRERLLTITDEELAALEPQPRFAGRMRHPSAWPASPQRRRRRRRLAVVLAGFTATTVGLGGIAVASGSALPGDALYGVKRTIEDVQLDFSGSGTDRAQQYLSLAETRLGEVEALVRRSGPRSTDGTAAARIGGGLADFSTNVHQAADILIPEARNGQPTAAHDLIGWVAAHRARWMALGPVVPASDYGQWVRITDQLNTLLGQAAPLAAPPGPAGSPGPGPAAATGRGSTSAGTSPAASPGTSPTPGGTTARPGATSGAPTPSTGAVAGSGTSPTAGATKTPGNSLDVNVPPLLPGQPGVELSLPPLLPGLPGVGIGIGN